MSTPEPLRKAPAGSKSKLFKLAILMFLLVPFFFSIFSYNVERNYRTRKKLRVACERITGVLDVYRAPALAPIFAEDGPVLVRDLRAQTDQDCAFLDDQLAVWKLNIARKVAIPRDDARRARLMAAADRVAARCPEALRPMFRALTNDESKIDVAVTNTCAVIRAPSRISHPDNEAVEVWAWADDYVRFGDAVAKQAPRLRTLVARR